MDQPPQLEAVLASNVARLREARALTQDQLVEELLLHGLRWNRATVAAVETGRRRVRLSEGVVLCAELGVSMADLVTPPGDAVTVDAGTWSARYLRAVVEGDEDYSGFEYTSPALKALNRFARSALDVHSQWRDQRVETLSARWDLDPEKTMHVEMNRILYHDDPMDTEVARRVDKRVQLGVTAGEVMLAAQSTWACSFHDERERRVAERRGNVQAVRGRVTRELEAELRQAIEDAADRAAERLDR